MTEIGPKVTLRRGPIFDILGQRLKDVPMVEASNESVRRPSFINVGTIVMLLVMVGRWDSVHPPRGAQLSALLDCPNLPCLEVMYPGEAIGDGYSVEAAMEAGLLLAVDVSHIFIQREQNAMSAETWKRLQDYERISEIHVSANDGKRDRHQPIVRGTFGLDWARARSATGTPVILEAYFHQLNEDQRREQVALVRGM